MNFIRPKKSSTPAKAYDSNFSFPQLISVFSASLVVIYAFTWGYIYELGIPENPDLSKSAYFFFTVFANTIFHGVVDYLFSDNFFYRKIGICIALGVVGFFLFRRAVLKVISSNVFQLITKWFLSRWRLIVIGVILCLPLICVLLANYLFDPAMVYSHRLGRWILLDGSFICYALGIFSAFIIPMLMPFYLKRIRQSISAIIFIIILIYSAMTCFYLSKNGLKFMHFPVAIIDEKKPQRLPHLWFSERARYVAICGENSWRLEGITYDNKIFYISDPKSDDLPYVCRFKHPWSRDI